MTKNVLINTLERSPVIAAVRDDGFSDAISSSAEVIFYLKASLITVKERIDEALKRGKMIFVHIDLAEGIGKDRAGVSFLASCGVTGIISTRSQLINYAKEEGLLTVQRFFALDSQGVSNIRDISESADIIEIMPGVIKKVLERFAHSGADVIAGGLIETKDEVMMALKSGTVAVSTGRKELWEI